MLQCVYLPSSWPCAWEQLSADSDEKWREHRGVEHGYERLQGNNGDILSKCVDHEQTIWDDVGVLSQCVTWYVMFKIQL